MNMAALKMDAILRRIAEMWCILTNVNLYCLCYFRKKFQSIFNPDLFLTHNFTFS